MKKNVYLLLLLFYQINTALLSGSELKVNGINHNSLLTLFSSALGYGKKTTEYLKGTACIILSTHLSLLDRSMPTKKTPSQAAVPTLKSLVEKADADTAKKALVPKKWTYFKSPNDTPLPQIKILQHLRLTNIIKNPIVNNPSNSEYHTILKNLAYASPTLPDNCKPKMASLLITIAESRLGPLTIIQEKSKILVIQLSNTLPIDLIEYIAQHVILPLHVIALLTEQRRYPTYDRKRLTIQSDTLEQRVVEVTDDVTDMVGIPESASFITSAQSLPELPNATITTRTETVPLIEEISDTIHQEKIILPLHKRLWSSICNIATILLAPFIYVIIPFQDLLYSVF